MSRKKCLLKASAKAKTFTSKIVLKKKGEIDDASHTCRYWLCACDGLIMLSQQGSEESAASS
jgi:hypothetical protein